MSGMIIAIAGVFASGLPSLLEWRRARRLRRLAEARLMIAQATTRMQRFLLSGEIQAGHVSHDRVFPLMQKTQFLDSLPVKWLYFPERPSIEGRQFATRLEEELNKLPEAASEQIDQFVRGITRACRYRHPVKFFFVLLTWTVLIGFVRALFTTHRLAEAWRKAKKEVQKQVLVRTYDAATSEPLIPELAGSLI